MEGGNGAMVIDNRIDGGLAQLWQFSIKHFFVFKNQRHGKVNVEPAQSDKREQLKRAAVSSPQPGDNCARVDDQLRQEHAGIL
jgi:hypothetical protein